MLLDKPEDNDEGNKAIPSFVSSISMAELPIEKQFTQRLFINQIQSLNLDQARELLESLHLMYLAQTVLFTKMAKQEFPGNLL